MITENGPPKLHQILNIDETGFSDFEYGILAALAAIKAAMEADPEKRVETVETAANYFIAKAANLGADNQRYKLPLQMLSMSQSAIKLAQ